MFKGFGYFSLFVFVLVGSQIGSMGPGFGLLFISLLLIVSGVLGFALLQFPSTLDQKNVEALTDFAHVDLKQLIAEITELAQIIRRDGLLVAEAHRKNLKDKKLQYLVKRSMEGFEKNQLLQWIESQAGFQKAQFELLQSFIDRVIFIFPVVGLMGSIVLLMKPAVALDVAFVPFLLTLFLQLLVQALFQEKMGEAKQKADLYFVLLKEGMVGIKDGVTAEFIQEQLAARMGQTP